MIRDLVRHSDLVARMGPEKTLELLQCIERITECHHDIVHLDKETRWTRAMHALNQLTLD